MLQCKALGRLRNSSSSHVGFPLFLSLSLSLSLADLPELNPQQACSTDPNPLATSLESEQQQLLLCLLPMRRGSNSLAELEGPKASGSGYRVLGFLGFRGIRV